jgi:YfiH family protein
MSPPALTFDSFDGFRDVVTHAIFTRHGGVSAPPFDTLNVSFSVGDDLGAIAVNRERCVNALGLASGAITAAGLLHGSAVGRIENSAFLPLPDGSRLVERVDALITATPGQGLLITAADCLQILLFDPLTPAIGLVHAGWRGLAGGVIPATLRSMAGAYGSRPSALLAGIGPGLGPCCAEFTNPHVELPAGFTRYITGRYVDLWSAAADQLQEAGVERRSIECLSLCTRCNRDQFFSHRGDQGRTGRFAAIVALRESPSPLLSL